MAISYKPLWHLLVEREMNKEDLKRAANITDHNKHQPYSHNGTEKDGSQYTVIQFISKTENSIFRHKTAKDPVGILIGNIICIQAYF